MKSALEIQETEGKLSRNTGNRRRILSKYRKEKEISLKIQETRIILKHRKQKENSLEIQETEGNFSKNT